MLHIILLILKIFGLLLLAVAGILLFLLLLVLFVPVRYRGRGSYYGKGKGSAVISWLLHILTIRVEYDEDVTVAVRFFGFRILKPKKIDEELEEAEEIMVHAMERVEPEVFKEAEELKEEVLLDTQNEQPEPKKKRIRLSVFWNHVRKRIRRILSKIKFFFRRIYDTLRTVNEKKNEIYAWFSNKDNQKTVRLFLKQSKKLIRHIFPLKGKGTVTFGFEDPYMTGQVLVYASAVYPFCHKHLDLYPMFDRAVFEAEGEFRGRIRVWTLLMIGGRMLMDKNFRILFKRWLR